MTNKFLLSKFKAMSADSISQEIREKGTISVFSNDVHMFDVVLPVNALSEQLLKIGDFIASVVQDEFNRKAASLRAEEMFDAHNVSAVLKSAAEKLPELQKEEEDVKDVVPAKKNKPKPVTTRKKKPTQAPTTKKPAITVNRKPASASKKTEQAPAATISEFDDRVDEEMSFEPWHNGDGQPEVSVKNYEEAFDAPMTFEPWADSVEGPVVETRNADKLPDDRAFSEIEDSFWDEEPKEDADVDSFFNDEK